jgi:hypothetical protein
MQKSYLIGCQNYKIIRAISLVCERHVGRHVVCHEANILIRNSQSNSFLLCYNYATLGLGAKNTKIDKKSTKIEVAQDNVTHMSRGVPRGYIRIYSVCIEN